MTATITRAHVFRNRWSEARMITDALVVRLRRLKQRREDPTQNDYLRTVYDRCIQTTEIELAEARAREAAAWAEISAEEQANAAERAALRFKEHRR